MPCVGARCARARCLSLARGTAALPHSTNAHHHELRMCNTPCTPTDLHEQWRPSAGHLGCNRGGPPLRVQPRAPRPPAAAPAARQIRRQAQQPAARRRHQERGRWQAKALGDVLGGGQEAQTYQREKRGAPLQTPPVPQNQRVQTNRSPLTTSLLTAHHTPLRPPPICSPPCHLPSLQAAAAAAFLRDPNGLLVWSPNVRVWLLR